MQRKTILPLLAAALVMAACTTSAPSTSSVPTSEPTSQPTSTPTSEPTSVPTSEPTSEPTSAPTSEPTSTPTSEPTSEPTSAPTSEPTSTPTSEPTSEPTSVDTLTPAKETAKGELDSYVDLNDYRSEEQTTIAGLIQSGKDAIDAATDVDAVAAALAAAKAAIDAVYTDAELTEMYTEMDIVVDFYEIARWANDGARLFVKSHTPDGKDHMHALGLQDWTSYTTKVEKGASTVQLLRLSNADDTIWENSDVFEFDNSVNHFYWHLGETQSFAPYVEPNRVYLNIKAIVSGDASWEYFALALHKSADGASEANDIFQTFVPNAAGKFCMMNVEGYDSFKLLRLPTLPQGTELTWNLFRDGSHDWGHSDNYVAFDADKPFFVVTSKNLTPIKGGCYALDDAFDVTVTNSTPDYGTVETYPETLTNLAPGTPVSISAEANEGYEIESATLNGEAITFTDGIYSHLVAGNDAIVVTFREIPQNLRTLYIDFSDSTGIHTGNGYEKVFAYFFTTEGQENGWAEIVKADNFGSVIVPEWANKVKILRAPTSADPATVSWDWFNTPGNFWGGNIESDLPANVSVAKIGTDYKLSYLPTSLTVAVEASGVLTGGERFGFYFYNKVNGENTWALGTVDGTDIKVDIPAGPYTHFKMLRTSIADKALAWDCEWWGQLDETALVTDNNKFVLKTFPQGGHMTGEWYVEPAPVADRYLSIDLGGLSSSLLTGGEQFNAYFWNVAGTVGEFAKLNLEGKIGTCKVPAGAEKIKVIRTPITNDRVTWEWINDSHFWGGNVECTLAADTEFAVMGDDFKIVAMPKAITVTVTASGVVNGDEKYGFYFYNKSTGANEWVEASRSGNVLSAAVKKGYTHFKILRTDPNTETLSWDAAFWGGTDEIALTDASTNYIVDGWNSGTGAMTGHWEVAA